MKIELKVKMPVSFTINLVSGRQPTIEDLSYDLVLEESELLDLVYLSINKQLQELGLPSAKSLLER